MRPSIIRAKASQQQIGSQIRLRDLPGQRSRSMNSGCHIARTSGRLEYSNLAAAVSTRDHPLSTVVSGSHKFVEYGTRTSLRKSTARNRTVVTTCSSVRSEEW